jgi:hypothetical protein
MGDGWWMFVGFLPLDNDEVDYQDLDETERREFYRRAAQALRNAGKEFADVSPGRGRADPLSRR